MPAGPYPTKAMFEALKAQVEGLGSSAPTSSNAPWAFEEHFARDVPDPATEGYTSSWPGALDIIRLYDGPYLNTLGVLGIFAQAQSFGSATVDAVFPQTFPPLGEFLVRLGVMQTSPAINTDIRFLLLSGTDLMVTFNLTNAWTATAGGEWATPMPVGQWATVRVRITPQDVTFVGPGGTLAYPMPADWMIGAAPWTARVEVRAGPVPEPEQSACGVVDVLAWRPLDGGDV